MSERRQCYSDFKILDFLNEFFATVSPTVPLDQFQETKAGILLQHWYIKYLDRGVNKITPAKEEFNIVSPNLNLFYF